MDEDINHYLVVLTLSRDHFRCRAHAAVDVPVYTYEKKKVISGWKK